jgi:hypothetical protein
MSRTLAPHELRASLREALDASTDPGEALLTLCIELLVQLHTQGGLLSESIDRIMAEVEKAK